MENEEKKVDETITPASGEEKTQESVEKTDDVDYKKELEDAQTQLGKAEHTIVKEKGKRKEAEEETEKAKSEAPTFTLDDVRQTIREENQSFYKETRKSDIENKIRSMTGSEDEAKLALFNYQNKIAVSGNDQEDIENAILLANKKRYSSIASEAEATANSNDTVQRTAGGAGQKVAKPEESSLSDQDKKMMNNYGVPMEHVTPDGVFDREAAKKAAKAAQVATMKRP